MTPSYYDAAYFIEKFTAIPSERWITDDYADDFGRCCALGHCGERMESRTVPEEAKALIRLFSTVGYAVSDVNDGLVGRKALSPKARVIAVLRKIQRSERQNGQYKTVGLRDGR